MSRKAITAGLVRPGISTFPSRTGRDGVRWGGDVFPVVVVGVPGEVPVFEAEVGRVWDDGDDDGDGDDDRDDDRDVGAEAVVRPEDDVIVSETTVGEEENGDDAGDRVGDGEFEELGW